MQHEPDWDCYLMMCEFCGVIIPIFYDREMERSTITFRLGNTLLGVAIYHQCDPSALEGV